MAEPAAASQAAHDDPINPTPIKPQPVAGPTVLQRQTQTDPSSAAAEIEAGTTGAASVAGLGASKFGPMSLDFKLDAKSSHTDPLPAFTPQQIAAIARNKLELAAEYIDLGDLSGARTLLQEVIESNDPATRQQAAALLSTLAPHS
ncbi:transmembrane protein [Caballeronia terrestris]|uniref:Transmembrane protein n=1 Tax=Caballeronia terrestris TaxID=1226301 RepID=A0A158G9Y0_9BURK|nr:transmembrane protein [Caballeronia terrestris]